MSTELFSKLESQYGLPAGILDKVWETESGRGKYMKSDKGAEGHFQFIPVTAKRFGVQPYDLNSSATGAAKYLSTLYKQFGNWEDAVAAYNWGEGNLAKYKAGKAEMPEETQQYMVKVLGGAPKSEPKRKFMFDENTPQPTAPKRRFVFDDQPTPQAAPTGPNFEASPVPQDEDPVARRKRLAKDFEDRPGSTLIPMGAGIAGGIVGGMATPGMPIIGGAVGGTLAPALARLATLPDKDEAGNPVSFTDKLDYVWEEGKLDALMSAGGAAVIKGVPMLYKAAVAAAAKSGQSPNVVNQWFASRGLPIPESSPYLTAKGLPEYSEGAKKMQQGIDNAWQQARDRAGVGVRGPETAGDWFQEGYSKARSAIGEESERLLAPFKRGGRFSTMLTPPGADTISMSKSLLKDMERLKVADADVGAAKQISGLLEELASGKPLALGDAYLLKQFFSGTAVWDKVNVGADNAIRKKLATQLDAAIEGTLEKASPAFRQQWDEANATISRNLDIFNDQTITKLASMDPSKLPEFVGKNATPRTIRKVRQVMMGPEFTDEMRQTVLDNIRRNWMTAEGTPSKLADIYRASASPGGNREAMEVFDTLYRGTPEHSNLLQIGAAMNRMEQWAKSLPRPKGSVGDISGEAALGSIVAGGAGASTVLGTLTGINKLSKDLAKAAMDPTKQQYVRPIALWLRSANGGQYSKFARVGGGAKALAAQMPNEIAKIYLRMVGEEANE